MSFSEKLNDFKKGGIPLLTNTIKKLIPSNKINIKLLLIILVVTSIFLILSIYVYYSYIKKRIAPTFAENKEFITKESLNTGSLYFIYADWCPYSTQAKKILQQYKKDNPVKNGITIDYVFIDGDKEEGALIEFETRHKKKLEGYPTLFLDIKDQLIEYDATINNENLDNFFNTVV
jgi:glutaredoxin